MFRFSFLLSIFLLLIPYFSLPFLPSNLFLSCSMAKETYERSRRSTIHVLFVRKCIKAFQVFNTRFVIARGLLSARVGTNQSVYFGW